jgi:hypothetical protein
MPNTSLLAHELFCLHLKSFYGEQARPASSEAPAVSVLKKKVGKRTHLLLRKWR